jgi:hypothetical protein
MRYRRYPQQFIDGSFHGNRRSESYIRVEKNFHTHLPHLVTDVGEIRYKGSARNAVKHLLVLKGRRFLAGVKETFTLVS